MEGVQEISSTHIERRHIQDYRTRTDSITIVGNFIENTEDEDTTDSPSVEGRSIESFHRRLLHGKFLGLYLQMPFEG